MNTTRKIDKFAWGEDREGHIFKGTVQMIDGKLHFTTIDLPGWKWASRCVAKQELGPGIKCVGEEHSFDPADTPIVTTIWEGLE